MCDVCNMFHEMSENRTNILSPGQLYYNENGWGDIDLIERDISINHCHLIVLKGNKNVIVLKTMNNFVRIKRFTEEVSRCICL